MFAWLALSAFVVLALAVDMRFGTDGTRNVADTRAL